MTPKEKAQDLYANYEDVNHMFHVYNKVDDIVNHAKESALIAVDELIYFSSNQSLSVDFDSNYYCDYDFFIEVKKEIEAL
jgi:hypothetical protein